MAKKRYLEVSEKVIDYVESPGNLEPADAERCGLQLLYSIVLALAEVSKQLEKFDNPTVIVCGRCEIAFWYGVTECPHCNGPLTYFEADSVESKEEE